MNATEMLQALGHYLDAMPKDWRTGQGCMNFLGEYEPDLYGIIHGTDADCFYRDNRVPTFMQVVFG